MNKKILITGATGFVGRQVVRSLCNKGAKLTLVVRDGKENQVELCSDKHEIINTKDVFFETAEWWAKQCDGIDTVIHLAWYAEPGQYLQSNKNIDCLVGTINLAKGAIQAGVKRFVGIGTCFEYDLTGGVLSIDTPLKPISMYADAKASVYLTLSHWLPSHSVEFAWCRLFYMYGEGEDHRRLVAYVRSRLEDCQPVELTSGDQIRDFLNVELVGEMIANSTISSQTGPINICSGRPITVRQLVEKIADEYGRRELLHFGTKPNNIIDPYCILGVPNQHVLDLQ
jgi:nucleoside-diphosphate-sugar epimerase